MAAAMTLLAVAFLAGCGGPETERVTLVLFDDSNSAGPMKDRYGEVAETVTESLSDGERVVMGQITGASMRDARLPVDVKVPAFSPLTQTTGLHRKAKEEAQAQLQAQAKSLIEEALLGGRSSKCTDLIGSMKIAQKVFRNAEPGAEKRLLVASDMVETCGPNLRRRALTTETADTLFQRLREKDRFPDLEGAHVWVAGATSTTDIPPERARSIEKFWIQFFRAAGAKIEPSHYGPTLMGW
ncbi:hypothetical protein [Salinibacter grassmerensis]|uniref:hypothetical protein n=1 Tax=Salinibacter grassmerensis TaxID=3040353 RepID=UPI0021E76E45|nr:hypothetical protein [Salinibacter grassmerensis]